MDGFGKMTHTNKPNYYYLGGWSKGRRSGNAERMNNDGTLTILTSVE